MKIKADNRGRISLAQLGTGYSKKDLVHIGAPHTEWEADVVNGQVTFKYAGEDAKPVKEKWEKIHPEGLRPEHIGQVVGIQSRETEIRTVDYLIDNTKQDGLWGVLECYSKGENVEMKLKGHPDILTNEFREGKFRITSVIVKS